MLLGQSVQVGLGRHVGVAESVLHSRRRADVLVEELLSRLLGDGFGRHDWSLTLRRGRGVGRGEERGVNTQNIHRGQKERDAELASSFLTVF